MFIEDDLVVIYHGRDGDYEITEDLLLESTVPADCFSGCEVEPDGTCPHGNKSILLLAGLI